MSNITQHFFNAISDCVGDSAIKTRLSSAWIEHLDAIQCAELPEPLQQEFRQLRDAMYSVTPQPGEHAAMAAVRKMSTNEAAQHTQTIAELFSQLANADTEVAEPQRRTQTIPSTEQPPAHEHNISLN